MSDTAMTFILMGLAFALGALIGAAIMVAIVLGNPE